MKKVYIVHYCSERGEEESDPSRVDLECLGGYYYNLTLKELDLL